MAIRWTAEVEALLHPVGWIWISLLAGCAVATVRRRPRTAVYCASLALVLQVFGATPVPALLLASLERPFDPRNRGESLGPHPPVDAVVMLGGTHDYTTRGPLPMNTGESCDRILGAIQRVRTERCEILVLGGSQYVREGEARPDSELIQRLVTEWGLAPKEVLLLGICSDTHDEAEKTVKLARDRGWRRVEVVTSGYHLKRSAALFEKLGMPVKMVGCDFVGLDSVEARNQWQWVPRIRILDMMRYWIHEQLGWWYYRWRGWV